MPDNQLLNVLDAVADLKALVPYTQLNLRTLLMGKTTVGDGMGGFYYYDPNSVVAEETTFMNVVAPNSGSGRWIRVFQRAQNLPQGVLVNNGGVKTLYVTTTTNSTGDATINLTTDNTPTGPSIFTEIWDNRSYARTTATGPSDAVQSYRKAETLKITTHGYYKANAVTITLGLLYNPFASVGAGTSVQFVVVGI